MSSLSLYEISDQYQALLNNLYDYETGVVDETALEKLTALTDTMQNKCINITKFFKTLEMAQKAIAEEKAKMAAREKAFKNQVERLKDYLLSNMQRCEIKKIECPEFVLAVQNNPPSVQVDDEKLVPHDYDKPPKERELDLRKILDELKNGVVIPGVRLVQKQSLRIR